MTKGLMKNINRHFIRVDARLGTACATNYAAEDSPRYYLQGWDSPRYYRRLKKASPGGGAFRMEVRGLLTSR